MNSYDFGVSRFPNEETVMGRTCTLWYCSLSFFFPSFLTWFVYPDHTPSGQKYFPDEAIFAFSFPKFWDLAVDIIVTECSKDTQLHAVLSHPKSTPAGDTIMQDLLGCWMGAATHTPLWDRLHSERLLVNSTCVDLPVCPTCSLQSCSKEGQREIIFVFPSWHASTAGLKDAPELFEGEYGSCFFCSPIFLPSLLMLGTVEGLNHHTVVFDQNEEAACCAVRVSILCWWTWSFVGFILYLQTTMFIKSLFYRYIYRFKKVIFDNCFLWHWGMLSAVSLLFLDSPLQECVSDLVGQYSCICRFMSIFTYGC